MKPVQKFVLPEKVKQLNKEDAGTYFRNTLSVAPFLEQEVIKPIELALKKRTRYSDTRLPPENVVEQKYVVGEGEFTVKTIITDKRPSYASIFTTLYDYMYIAEEHAELGIKRDDLIVKKIRKHKRAYIRGDTLVEILTRKRERITEKGIKQEILYKTVEPPTEIMVPQINYSKLPPEAGMLPEFKSFYDELIKRVIETFEGLITEGVKKERWRNISEYLFHVCRIPSSSTEYGKLCDALLSTKKEIGELILIANNQHNLLKKSILSTYSVISGNGKNYISIKGLSKRLEQLTEEYTKEKAPTTKLFFYPFV